MLEMYAKYIIMLSECITTGRLSSVQSNVQRQCLTEPNPGPCKKEPRRYAPSSPSQRLTNEC